METIYRCPRADVYKFFKSRLPHICTLSSHLYSCSPTERVFLGQIVGSSSPHISCYEIAWHPTQCKTDLNKPWERKLRRMEVYLTVWRFSSTAFFFFSIFYADAKAFYSGFIVSFKLKQVLKQFTINLKCQFNSTHSFQEPLTAGRELRHGNWFSSGLIPPWILSWSTEKEAVMTHSVIPQFLYDVVRFYPNATRPVINLVFLPSACQQLGAVKGSHPKQNVIPAC